MTVLVIFHNNTENVQSVNSCRHYLLKVNNQNSTKNSKTWLKLIPRLQNHVNDIVLWSFFLTSNIFHTLFYYCYCWYWACHASWDYIEVLFFFSKEHVDTLILKEIKNVTHPLLLKVHPIICVISIVLHYEQLCRAPTSPNDGIFFWYFATLNFDSFSFKLCLRFHRWCFFRQKRSFLVEQIY